MCSAVIGVGVNVQFNQWKGSDAIMFLIEFCKEGDLEGVKAALQRGDDVNKNEYGWTALMWAVFYNHNSVVALLLRSSPKIDVNQQDKQGKCALHYASEWKNNGALKLLLDVPTIDVNIVTNIGDSAVHRACLGDNVEGLKLLLSHPSLTAPTLNLKDKCYGDTPVMLAVKQNRLKPLEVLAADPRVDLDTTDKEGRSLESQIIPYSFFLCDPL